MSKQPPPAPTARAVGPCPTLIQTSRTPRHWKFTQDHRTARSPPFLDEIWGMSAKLKVNGCTFRGRNSTFLISVSIRYVGQLLKEKFPPPEDRVAQSVGHLTRKSGALGSIPGLATYFRFSFRFFKKGSCQLLAKVRARSTG